MGHSPFAGFADDGVAVVLQALDQIGHVMDLVIRDDGAGAGMFRPMAVGTGDFVQTVFFRPGQGDVIAVVMVGMRILDFDAQKIFRIVTVMPLRKGWA